MSKIPVNRGEEIAQQTGGGEKPREQHLHETPRVPLRAAPVKNATGRSVVRHGHQGQHQKVTDRQVGHQDVAIWPMLQSPDDDQGHGVAKKTQQEHDTANGEEEDHSGQVGHVTREDAGTILDSDIIKHRGGSSVCDVIIRH